MTTLRLTRDASTYQGVELPAIHYTMDINHHTSTEEITDVRVGFGASPDSFARKWFLMDQDAYDAMTGLMAAACYQRLHEALVGGSCSVLEVSRG